MRIAMVQASLTTRTRPHRWQRSVVLALAALASTALTACAGGAASGSSSGTPADFYHGKTVEILVPNAPGGNIDVTARLAAPYLQKYLGAAAVKVVDVTGAGGVVGLDQLWNSSKNGLTIGYTNVPVALLTGIVGGQGVTYQPGKFIYLGRLTAAPRLLVVSSKSPIKTLADLKGKTVKVPSQGFDDSFYTIAALGHSLGFTPEYVTGFASLAAQTDSLATGATTMLEASVSSLQPSINSGLVRPVLIETPGPKPSHYSNLPQWSTAATTDTSLVSAFTSLISIEGSYFMPPGSPSAAVTAFRAAFTKVAADQAFRGKATKAGSELDYMAGAPENAAIQKLLKEIAPYTATLRKDKASVAG